MRAGVTRAQLEPNATIEFHVTEPCSQQRSSMRYREKKKTADIRSYSPPLNGTMRGPSDFRFSSAAAAAAGISSGVVGLMHMQRGTALITTISSSAGAPEMAAFLSVGTLLLFGERGKKHTKRYRALGVRILTSPCISGSLAGFGRTRFVCSEKRPKGDLGIFCSTCAL